MGLRRLARPVLHVEIAEVVGEKALDRPVAPAAHRQLAGREQVAGVGAFHCRRNLVDMHQVVDEGDRLEHLGIVEVRVGPIGVELGGAVGQQPGLQAKVEVWNAETEHLVGAAAGRQLLRDRQEVIPGPVRLGRVDPGILEHLGVVVYYHIVPGVRDIPGLAVDLERLDQRWRNVVGQLFGGGVAGKELVERLQQPFLDQQPRAFDRDVDDVGRLPTSHLGRDFVRVLRPGGDGGEVVVDRDVRELLFEAGVGVGIDLLVGIAAEVEDRQRGCRVRRRCRCPATSGRGRGSAAAAGRQERDRAGGSDEFEEVASGWRSSGAVHAGPPCR